jgi:hypothetical protein
MSAESTSPYRLSAFVNEALMNGERLQVPPPPHGVLQELPEPVFPQHPKLFAAPDEAYLPKNGKRHCTARQVYHAMQGWMFPYFRSLAT